MFFILWQCLTFFSMSIIMYGGAAFVQRNYTTELPSFAIPAELKTEFWVPHEWIIELYVCIYIYTF
jgi:hypothetical protein